MKFANRSKEEMEMMGKGCNILTNEVTTEISGDTRLEESESLLKEAHLALQGAYANLASNTKPNMKRLIFDTMVKVKKHSRR